MIHFLIHVSAANEVVTNIASIAAVAPQVATNTAVAVAPQLKTNTASFAVAPQAATNTGTDTEGACTDGSHKCGNLCTKSWCTCGDGKLEVGSNQYCCLPPGETCRYSIQDLEGFPVQADCSSGKLLDKAEPCHGACPDQSQTDSSGHLSCYEKNCPKDNSWYWCNDLCLRKSWKPCNRTCPDENQQIKTNTDGELICENICGKDSYKCGDLCVKIWTKCICGNTTLTYGGAENHHCCVPPGDHCTHDGIDALGNAKNPVCSTGQIIRKVEPCHGSCPQNSNSTPAVVDGLLSCGCPDESHLVIDAATGYVGCQRDKCPHEEGWYWCGDICMKKYRDCTCGNTTLQFSQTQKYCCLPPGEHCDTLNNVCSAGQVVHKSKPCHGNCAEGIDTIKTQSTDLLTCKYTDHCNYSNWDDHENNDKYGNPRYTMCGDVCIYSAKPWQFSCKCGEVTLFANSSDYCCLDPGHHCKRTTHYSSEINDNVYEGTCPSGYPVDKSLPCQNVCYNDYHNSRYLGDDSHLTCAGGDKCVRKGEVNDGCRGEGLCAGPVAAEECGEPLRCGEAATLRNRTNWEGGQHFFCTDNSMPNTKTYEILDRSDEEHIENILLHSKESSYKDLHRCKSSHDDGLQCTRENCKKNFEWCRSDPRYKTSCTTPNSDTVESDDPLLCADHVLMRDVDCNHNWGGSTVSWYGRRCSGSNQHCSYPWYFYGSDTRYILSVDPNYSGPRYKQFFHYEENKANFQPNCTDHSDRIFHMNTTCPEAKLYLQIERDLAIWDPLTLQHSWVVDVLQHSPWLQDPYRCQDSCLEPGPQCSACTNPTYFACSQSGTCVPEELVCDGHPQCEFAEDEIGCLPKYIVKKLVSPFATLECSSLQYPGTPTLSAPCDGVVECSDASDEVVCKKQNLQTYLQIGTSLLILGIYLVLKYPCRKDKKSKIFIPAEEKPLQKLLQDFETHLDETETIGNVNTYLFHVLFSKPADEAKDIYKQFYEVMAKVHDNDKSKIVHSLHQHLHPQLVDEILNAALPGLKQRGIDCLEWIFCSRWITNFHNLVIRKEWLSEVISTIFTMIKITSNYVDIFKDTFLMVSLMQIVGGPYAVLLYPTKFSSAIVLGLAASIVLPLLASSLQIAINNPTLIFSFQARRSVTIVMCLVCSVFIPIFLINSYEAAKEKTKLRAKKNSQDRRVPDMIVKCNNIKNQLVDFLQIELGICRIIKILI